MAQEWQQDWTEIKVTVKSEDIETAANISNMTVPYGIYIEDYSDVVDETLEIAHVDLISEELLGKDRTKGIIHIYISLRKILLKQCLFLRKGSAQKISHMK